MEYQSAIFSKNMTVRFLFDIYDMVNIISLLGNDSLGL